MRQVNDTAFFHKPGEHSNSIALILKHVAGNLASRWTDFLSSDGEKPWRDGHRYDQKNERLAVEPPQRPVMQRRSGIMVVTKCNAIFRKRRNLLQLTIASALAVAMALSLVPPMASAAWRRDSYPFVDLNRVFP